MSFIRYPNGLVGLVLLALVGLAVAVMFRRSPGPRNVILVSIDSLRPDHLGCYGYDRDTSPVIDGLAREGGRFEVVTSSTSWTLPAHAALLTGLPDRVHGCYNQARWLDGSRQTLAEAFHAAGYQTVGFYSAPFLHPAYGFAQGFDSYHDCTSYSAFIIEAIRAGRLSEGSRGRSHRDITNPNVFREVKRWLERRRGGPVFAFIHLWDVHYDYIPPAPYDTMFDPDYRGSVDGRSMLQRVVRPADWSDRDVAHVVALYDGEIRWTDFALGRILDAFRRHGLLDDAVIAVTADHGEAFYEHGHHGHRSTLYEEEIRIPLVVHCPGAVPPGTRVTQPVEITDVAPTLLDLADAPPLAVTYGRSLVPLLEDPSAVWPPRPAISELDLSIKPLHLFAIRNPPWKRILDLNTGRREAFDLARDPGERAPLDAADPAFPPTARTARYSAIARALQQTLQRLGEPGERDTPPIDRMTDAQLRSLGYLK